MSDLELIPEEEERALATVETVAALDAIPGADNIVCASIRGWKLVTQKSNFEVGDKCIYFEVDSYLDVTDPRFEFLAARSQRKDPHGSDFIGHVLETIKLRKQLSQGLIIPIAEFPELADYEVGDDVTKVLNIRKWDPPTPEEMEGVAVGFRPPFVPRTQASRIQNVHLNRVTDHENWFASEKLNGESVSYFWHAKRGSGLCSRKWEIEREVKCPHWTVENELDILDKIEAFGKSVKPDLQHIVVQGELAGAGIKKNTLKLDNTTWFCYRILIDGEDVLPDDWDLDIPMVPFLPNYTLPEEVEEAEFMADQVSVVYKMRKEGIVWRYYGEDGDQSVQETAIKIISPKYSLKHGD